MQNKDGKEFNGKVWPGKCAFPDFTRPETRAWWGDLYKNYMAQGVDGVWNDMNELRANWAKDNFAETVDIYAKGSWLDDPEAEKRARPSHFHLNLVPHLAESAVVSLEVEKNFLLRHGFIKQDFSVRDWVDDSFLEAALRAEQALPNVA